MTPAERLHLLELALAKHADPEQAVALARRMAAFVEGGVEPALLTASGVPPATDRGRPSDPPGSPGGDQGRGPAATRGGNKHDPHDPHDLASRVKLPGSMPYYDPGVDRVFYAARAAAGPNHRKHWELSEIIEIEELYDAGLHVPEIAAQVGRSVSSIGGAFYEGILRSPHYRGPVALQPSPSRLRMDALREQYAAEQARLNPPLP